MFRKSLVDRKTFLKQNGVCFRCVASTTHQDKNCEKRVQCTECNSKRHHSALHPGPAKEPSKASTPPEESGREDKIDMPTDAVSSRCTEVCGKDLFGKLCTKICLAKIFPNGQREKAIKIYVIIDDQSNRSFVRSDIFNLFDIKADLLTKNLRWHS